MTESTAIILDINPLFPSKEGHENTLPMLVQAPEPGIPLLSVFDEVKRLIKNYLPIAGGVLFRGFEIENTEQFREFASDFGHPLLTYEFGSTPRTNVGKGVYTSTEYPAHQHIPLHNEQAYSRDWPMNIWFYSIIAAQTGGETPIADSRQIYNKLSKYIRDRFAEHGLMYVRNFGGGLGADWQDVFNTEDPNVVEEYCQAHNITCEWKDDGELRTTQICQAIARHPKTNEMIWFNQAHLFHISNLEPEVRESLLDIVDIEDLPRNVYYGDGSTIEDSILDEVREVLEQCKVSFPWQAGDILMLDNMLAAHSRAPFTGERKVVVAMSEGFSMDML